MKEESVYLENPTREEQLKAMICMLRNKMHYLKGFADCLQNNKFETQITSIQTLLNAFEKGEIKVHVKNRITSPCPTSTAVDSGGRCSAPVSDNQSDRWMDFKDE